MKKLIPLFAALALTFGAVTAFAGKTAPAPTQKSTKKSTKGKSTK